MGFVEGNLLEAKLLGNDVFPKALLPAAGSNRNLAKSVAAERESVIAALHRHGALLFRGFEVASDGDFERVVEAFDWANYQFAQGANTRIKLSDRIFTSTEFPLEQTITFHHEMSLRKPPPSKIFFYCSEPSPDGGETSIVASNVVVEKMEERMPEVMAKVAEVGLIHVFQTFSDDEVGTKGMLAYSWKSYLGTDDEDKARKRALEITCCKEVHLFSDQRAEYIFGPLNPVVERDGKRTWIVTINSFANDVDLVTNKFGDETTFPLEAVHTYKAILEENCVDIKWQKGDVLLLDNLVVQHARRPGKLPRRVLVSMCK